MGQVRCICMSPDRVCVWCGLLMPCDRINNWQAQIPCEFMTTVPTISFLSSLSFSTACQHLFGIIVEPTLRLWRSLKLYFHKESMDTLYISARLISNSLLSSYFD